MVTVQKTWKSKLGLLQTEGLSLRLTFELTNQDSAGGKNSTVLHSMYKVNRKSSEIGQLFLLEKALNIYEKEFRIRKTILDCKK